MRMVFRVLMVAVSLAGASRGLAFQEGISATSDGGIVVLAGGGIELSGSLEARGALVLQGRLEVGRDLRASSPDLENGHLVLRGLSTHRLEVPLDTRVREVTLGGPVIGRLAPLGVRVEPEGGDARVAPGAAGARVPPPALAPAQASRSANSSLPAPAIEPRRDPAPSHLVRFSSEPARPRGPPRF